MNSVLSDLAIVMMISAVVLLIFQKLRQPVVLGYILAGIIIGPHTPPFQLVQSQESINTLSELGIIFLLFALGLEFRLGKLARVGVTAFLTAIFEIVLMLWFGREIGRAFGWSFIDSLFLGAILSVSSTTIIVKALGDLGRKGQLPSQLIVGTLIVEDIFSIAMLALLSSIAIHGTTNAGEALWTMGKLGVFLVATMVAGILLIPRIIDFIAEHFSAETLLVTVLGFCLGFCLLVHHMGYSVALGAFLIGALIGESRHIQTIEHMTEPLRDMFSAIFFVSIGLMIDPRIILDYGWPILVITIAVIVGKSLSCSAGAFISGRDGRTSLQVGMGLSQIGEFSFLFAALGQSLKVTSDFIYPITVSVAAITTFTTPYQIQSSDVLSRWISNHAPARISHLAGMYTEWLSSLGTSNKRQAVRAIINRLIRHLVINLCLVIAVFLGSNWISKKFILGDTPSEWMLFATWGGTLLLALPFIIAVYRKARVLGRVFVEIGVSNPDGRIGPERVRNVLAELVPLAALGGLFLLVGALSSTLLPPLELVALLVAVAIGLAILFWKKFTYIHVHLQTILKDTMDHEVP